VVAASVLFCLLFFVSFFVSFLWRILVEVFFPLSNAHTCNDFSPPLIVHSSNINVVSSLNGIFIFPYRRWCQLEFEGPSGVRYPLNQPGVDSFDEKERLKYLKNLPPATVDNDSSSAMVAASNEPKRARDTTFDDDEIEAAFRFIDLDKNGCVHVLLRLLMLKAFCASRAIVST
jgi:hypothetical protein